jgi:hypothetical protein
VRPWTDFCGESNESENINSVKFSRVLNDGEDEFRLEEEMKSVVIGDELFSFSGELVQFGQSFYENKFNFRRKIRSSLSVKFDDVADPFHFKIIG